MSGADFLDTNVVAYAYDAKNPRKQQLARQLLKGGVAGRVVISAQVLAEFAAIMLHKASPPATAQAVIEGLDALASIRLILPDAELVRRAYREQVYEANYRSPTFSHRVVNVQS